ncbi:uncharacterized protein C8A04DRAFT_12703, partial [Dichotomopilus funicola]
LYTSQKYSDLVISCGETEYHVHKAIVCSQSDFFAKACDAGFRETQEGRIDLSDHDPRLVQIMVHYLYNFEYDAQSQHESSPSPASETSGDGTVTKDTPENLVTHAKVYALAEMYLIPGLKALAVQKFKAEIKDISASVFCAVAVEVYTSTIESEEGLRDIVVETLSRNMGWIEKEEVQDLLKSHGTLGCALLLKIRIYWTWGAYLVERHAG